MNALSARIFFYFKQKTAYEITYGEWISDVCSSDLLSSSPLACRNASREELKAYCNALRERGKGAIEIAMTRQIGVMEDPRSEEHTSELQSPYVISYAVF